MYFTALAISNTTMLWMGWYEMMEAFWVWLSTEYHVQRDHSDGIMDALCWIRVWHLHLRSNFSLDSGFHDSPLRFGHRLASQNQGNILKKTRRRWLWLSFRFSHFAMHTYCTVTLWNQLTTARKRCVSSASLAFEFHNHDWVCVDTVVAVLLLFRLPPRHQHSACAQSGPVSWERPGKPWLRDVHITWSERATRNWVPWHWPSSPHPHCLCIWSWRMCWHLTGWRTSDCERRMSWWIVQVWCCGTPTLPSTSTCTVSPGPGTGLRFSGCLAVEDLPTEIWATLTKRHRHVNKVLSL